MDRIDICMIVDNDVQRDPRVRKEAASLAAQGWSVVVVGMSRSGPVPAGKETVAGFRIQRIIARLGRDRISGKPGQILRTIEAYIRAARLLRQVNARAYHAHDFLGLVVVALAGIWRRPVIYDTHELFFERPLPPITKRLAWLLRPLERVLAHHARRIITVSDGCGEYLVRTYGVNAPLILRNAVDLRDDGDSPVAFEAPSAHMIAHSGWLSAGRHLEELVDALALLPDSVGLVLVGGGALEASLKARATERGVAERLVTLGVIRTEQMVSTLRQATLSAVLITGDYQSYHYALPNKFFEAVAAGLPLLVSPIPEVKRLVEQYDMGLVCDPGDPHSIADAVGKLLEPAMLARMQANVRRAQAELSWETEERKLIALYDDVLREASA